MNGFKPSKGVGDGPDQAGKLQKCGQAPNCFSSDAPVQFSGFRVWG